MSVSKISNYDDPQSQNVSPYKFVIGKSIQNSPCATNKDRHTQLGNKSPMDFGSY